MGKWKRAYRMRGGIAVVALFVFAMGCGGQAPDETRDEHTIGSAIEPLELFGDEEFLRLLHAPADPAYQPTYPNPDGIERMLVEVSAAGRLEVECQGPEIQGTCRFHPFHTVFERLADGRSRIELMDLYGKIVAVGIADLALSGENTSGSPNEPTGDPACDPDDFTADTCHAHEGTSDATVDGDGTTAAVAMYSGEVGVEVDVLEGWLAAPGVALDPETPALARRSVAKDEYLSLSLQGQTFLYLSVKMASGTPASFRYPGTIAAGPDALEVRLHIESGADEYFAEPNGALGGVITHVSGEEGPDGSTRRLWVDAVWPDQSAVRLVVRYGSTAMTPPASMIAANLGPAPSYASFTGTCARPEAKEAFCSLVEAELASYDVAYAMDCAALPDVPVESPENRTAAGAGVARCENIMEAVTRELLRERGSDACIQVLSHTWWDYAANELKIDGACRDTSPLILDLAGNGVALSNPEGGVAFDLLGTGQAVQAAWPIGQDDALLALDLGDDGVIGSAEELFGHVTSGGSFADGFEALAAFDKNQDGFVDGADPVWEELRLWVDRNRDGWSAPEELSSLEEAGLLSVSVRPIVVGEEAARDEHGNRLPLVASTRLVDGGSAPVFDVFLRYRPLASEAEGATEIDRGVHSSMADEVRACAPIDR